MNEVMSMEVIRGILYVKNLYFLQFSGMHMWLCSPIQISVLIGWYQSH